MKTYAGWKNFETWNVSLWIQNDEVLYNLARSVQKEKEPYKSFVGLLSEGALLKDPYKTPDGVYWYNLDLDIRSLNAMIKEL